MMARFLLQKEVKLSTNKSSLTKIKCPNCEEVVEYDPTMVRILRNGHKSKWICPSCGHNEDFENITLYNSSTYLHTHTPHVEFTSYTHHGIKMWTIKELKGKYNEYCLCHYCQHWNPDTKDNCPIAQSLFEFTKDHNIVTPVWECAQFKEKE